VANQCNNDTSGSESRRFMVFQRSEQVQVKQVEQGGLRNAESPKVYMRKSIPSSRISDLATK